jgi:tetratricopeptide (TPR) repeat protein
VERAVARAIEASIGKSRLEDTTVRNPTFSKRAPLAVAFLLGLGLITQAPSVLADARTEARGHFKRGMTAISSGKYESGIDELKRAYDLLPHPNVLFNIARAYVEMGDIENAIQYYKQYTGENPPDREEVLVIVAQLQGRLDRQRATLAASQQVTPTPATGGPVGTQASEPPGTQTVEPRQTTAAPSPAQATVVSTGASGGPETGEVDTIAAGKQRTEAIYEESLVTASRGAAQSPLESPNSTTIISEQDIRLSGVIKLPELLRRVAGADVMQTTSGWTETSILWRHRLGVTIH